MNQLLSDKDDNRIQKPIGRKQTAEVTMSSINHITWKNEQKIYKERREHLNKAGR